MIDQAEILIIDDDPVSRLTLQRLLSREGYRVRCAEDGATGLRYAREYEPDLVLLDVVMPVLDGYAVCQALRSDPRLAEVPVVMLTSSREEQDLIRSYELGVNAFVVKPVDFKEFLEAIQGLGMFWGITNQPPPHGTLFGGKSRHDG